MKLSVMSYCYSRALAAGTLDLQGMLQECARLGLDGVELMRAHGAGVADRELRTRCDDLGLAIPILLEGAAIVDPDPARRRAGVEELRPAVESAVALGAGLIMLLPGGDAGSAPDAEVRRWIGEGGALACELARGSGVRIIMENHGGAARLRGRVEHMLEFCAAAPDLGLCFDDGNFFLAGENQDAAFERLAPRALHLHCKDWRPVHEGERGVAALDGRQYLGAVIGEGVVGPRPAVARLARAGFGGYLSVEYEGPEEPVAATARAVANARALLAV